jgi:hypothetical protein
MSDQRVAREVGELWNMTIQSEDLTQHEKLKVASLFVDYVAREKRRLDSQNPLFVGRSRQAEILVRAITTTVNAAAPSGGR